MKKVRILIVDDEHNTREALARYLKMRFDVTAAEDGGAAIELLRHEDFDLVLTDLRMPKADGMSVLEAAAGKACRPACVLLTAYGSITDAVAAVKKGAFDFVPKPVKLDKLEEVINAALAARKQEKALDDAVPKAVKVAAAPAPSADSENKLVLPQNADNPMFKVMEIVDVVAPTRSTVLLTGESGTGKEVVARLLHDRSGRTGYFVAVNCAALTPTLLESELFGHEKGAFTGANEQRKGRFERADHGTLFLDEIGEIDAATQVKLLRVLESRSFERVGGSEPIKVDIRLIAATNRDLRRMVADKEFREDLYYRLSVVNLELPPLRERIDDIPRLIQQFIREFSEDNGRSVSKIAPDALEILSQYPWPGNIRELRNCIENMVVRTTGDTLTSDVIPVEIKERKMLAVAPKEDTGVITTLENTEWAEIEKALALCKGNRTKAAEMLGISRRTLHRKLAAYQPENP